MPGFNFSLKSDSIDLTTHHRGFGFDTFYGNSVLISLQSWYS